MYATIAYIWPCVQFFGYLHTFLKNDVISSVRKHYYALRVRARFRVKAGVSGNTFPVKHVFEQVQISVFAFIL